MALHCGHYLPVRLVRLIKVVLIFTPLIVSLSLLILFLDALATEKQRENERKTKADLHTILERNSFCERRALDLPGTQKSGSATYNASVIEFCQQFELAQKAFFSRKPHKFNVFNHTIVKRGNEVCDENTFMVILVHSLHSYRDRRDAIRNTWGGATRNRTWPALSAWPPSSDVKVMFIFGQHSDPKMESNLEEESRIYGDIIQGDFAESYRNMTMKSLLGLKWVLDFCPSIKYLFKCDDDMFVNVAVVLNLLQTSPMSWSIMGPLNRGSKVYRGGKWGLSKDQYPFYYFPPYESGSGYVISIDLIQPLYETAEYVPWIFIDDVYITGILGKILEVNHVTRKGFAYWTSKAPSACEILKGSVLTGTKVNPKLQLDIWKQLKEGVQCSESNTNRTTSSSVLLSLS